MKTVSILQYDQEEHQFYPSFLIRNDFEDRDNECAFDEVVIHPPEEWMTEYLQWNRFSRLPDDPIEDPFLEKDGAIPVFESLQELHVFNAQGHDLTQRLRTELEQGNPCCSVQVAPFQPLYSNVVVGPVSAWWHVKDRNYGFVVPIQRLPVSNQLKSRLQAFRCHKGMEFWQLNDPDTMSKLQQEGRELQVDLLQELGSSGDQEETTNIDSSKASCSVANRANSVASLGALVEQSSSLKAAPFVEKGINRVPRVH